MVSTYDDREPVTRREHDHPWVADLETEDHASERERTVAEAIEAVEQTQPGQFVDLVTHREHGHPSEYLYETIRSMDRRVTVFDQGRCSCGGYVTRVTVRPLE